VVDSKQFQNVGNEDGTVSFIMESNCLIETFTLSDGEVFTEAFIYKENMANYPLNSNILESKVKSRLNQTEFNMCSSYKDGFVLN